MKILLLGKDGQVGLELQRTLLALGPVVALGRRQADLSQLHALETVLNTHKPTIIVNPAAYTAVDAAENDAGTAQQVNAQAPAVLAQWARQNAALLVHYSTDYVFNGKKPTAYIESDNPDPLNVYGQSKLGGEQAILDSGCEALILRTSWVVAGHGHNFLRTIARLATERTELSVVNDQLGAPTSAELLADVTALAIASHRWQRLPSGIYHLTATGSVSWHGLACHVVNTLHKQGIATLLKAENIAAIPTSDYPTPAARPENSCLDTRKLQEALQIQLPPWQAHVDRALEQLIQRMDLKKGQA